MNKETNSSEETLTSRKKQISIQLISVEEKKK